MKKYSLLFYVFAMLSIAIGFYPLVYITGSQEGGLLGTKSASLITNRIWNTGFYTHIIFGGVALLTGWSQFSKAIRRRYIKLHRLLGKIYVMSAFLSGGAAVGLSLYATGGLIPKTGFLFLGLIWLYTTIKAYKAITLKKIEAHQYWMIYSYAACFAAVTLRIWLPILQLITDDFLTAYRLVAWFCWVPNIIFAFFMLKSMKLKAV